LKKGGKEKNKSDGLCHFSSGHGGSKAKLETVSDEDFRDIATNSLFTVYDLIICEYKYRYFSLLCLDNLKKIQTNMHCKEIIRTSHFIIIIII